MEPTNNIPAFPLPEYVQVVRTHEGMTLLDYFAAQAMQGYLSNPVESTKLDALHLSNNEQMALISTGAYMQAAALLEARKNHIK